MASGDSQLSNSARLLAAQEFNRRALAQKAEEKLAKIEAERQQDLARTTRALEAQKLQARNAVEAQRIQDSINQKLASQQEQDRQAKINAQAVLDRQTAITKVVSGTGTNIETLSGRVTARDLSGRVIGLTNQESKTATTAKTRIVREVQRREVERNKVTDLERFLKNERALASGQVNKSQLAKQIADRKKRGLSQTPQQKLLSQKLRDQELSSALKSRVAKKSKFGSRAGEMTATFGQTQAENKKSLGRSQDFTNSKFIQGGGSSFGARAGDNSLGQINSQIALLESKRTGKSSGQLQNEQVALQIASGDYFSGLSNNELLTITSGQSDPSKRRKAQSAKSQKEDGIFQPSNKTLGGEAKSLNQSSPFAIIAQQDIPDPTTGITDREVQLFREDLKAKGEPVPDTSDFFSSGRAPRANDPFNDFAFGNFGGEDTTKIKKREKVALGDSIFADTQTRSDIEASRKEANKNSIFSGGFQDVSSQLRGTGVTQVTPTEKKRREKRARGLRAQGITGDFQSSISVRGGSLDLGIDPALQQSQTKRGGTPVRQPKVFNVSLTENVGISDRAVTTKTKSKTKTKSSNSTRPSNQTNVLTPPSNRPTNQNAFGGEQIDLTFGQGQNIRNAGQQVQGVIDSPFTQFGVQAVQGVIANPQKTVNNAKQSIDDFSKLFANTNFADPTAPARNIQIKGVNNQAIQNDAFAFLTQPFG